MTTNDDALVESGPPMTPIDELVKRCRYRRNESWAHVMELCADALEAQAAREHEWRANSIRQGNRIAEQDTRIATLEAELAEANEKLHYANGTCELAMKHRDAAEAQLETLKAAITDVSQSAFCEKRQFGKTYALTETKFNALMSALRNTETKDG